MKIISKILFWFLTTILVFIIVNMFFGIYKYGWINNYSKFLNEKDRKSTISNINIKNPISVFGIFYWDMEFFKWKVESFTGDVLDLSQETWSVLDTAILQTGSNEIDPYDPEFEEDFSNFFGNSDIDYSQEDVKIEDPGFINPDWYFEDNDTSLWQ